MPSLFSTYSTLYLGSTAISNTLVQTISPSAVTEMDLWGWWDATDVSSLSSKTLISGTSGLWLDKRYFSDISFTKRFMFPTTTNMTLISGVSAISFNGSSTYAKLFSDVQATVPETTVFTASGNSSNWSLFIVTRNVNTLSTIISQNISGTLSNRQFQIFRTNNDPSGNNFTSIILRGIENAVYDDFYISRGNMIGIPGIVDLTVNNTVTFPSITGVHSGSYGSPVSRILGNTLASQETNPHLLIGARSNGSNTSYTGYLNGTIGEILIYRHSSGSLSIDTKKKLINYLILKWNLSQPVYRIV